MDNPLIEALRANVVWWMLLLFLGVLFWGFRARIRARRENEKQRRGHSNG